MLRDGNTLQCGDVIERQDGLPEPTGGTEGFLRKEFNVSNGGQPEQILCGEDCTD